MELMADLRGCYADEIERLAGNVEEPDHTFRQESLADHVVLLYLWGVFPDDPLERFWHNAPMQVRQHAMWFLGQQLQRAAEQLPVEVRDRGFSYWERRLAAAKKSADPDSFREELGCIGQWCFGGNIDELWLSDQMIAMLEAGFVPANAFNVVEWLEKIATRHVDRAVELIKLLLADPRVDKWAYLTQRDPIRAVLNEGRVNGTAETIARVGEVVSYLASIGETGYLDLVPPPASAGK